MSRRDYGKEYPAGEYGLGPCASCGHDPACGFSSTWNAKDGERWYCHADDHSCYETAAFLLPERSHP